MLEFQVGDYLLFSYRQYHQTAPPYNFQQQLLSGFISMSLIRKDWLSMILNKRVYLSTPTAEREGLQREKAQEETCLGGGSPRIVHHYITIKSLNSSLHGSSSFLASRGSPRIVDHIIIIIIVFMCTESKTVEFGCIRNCGLFLDCPGMSYIRILQSETVEFGGSWSWYVLCTLYVRSETVEFFQHFPVYGYQ